jgi:hypothetical protein
MFACVLLPQAFGQQTPDPDSHNPSGMTNPRGAKPDNVDQNEDETKNRDQPKRALGIVPMYAVTNDPNVEPLTPRQKFHLFARSAFDPFEFVLVGAQAGIAQANDSFQDYGQGAAGYGKRYAAAFGDQISSGFFGSFFYPIVLKEDPRYFRLGEGTVKHRIGYAVAQVLVTHRDKDRSRTFNFSSVLGAVTAGGVSNAYYPPADRGFGLTMSRAGIALLYGSLYGLVDEFYPDVARKLFHKHRDQPAKP